MKNRRKVVEPVDDGWPWMGSNELEVPKATLFSDSDPGC